MSMHAATAVLVLGAVVSLGACAKQAPAPERAAEVTAEVAPVPAPTQALPLVVVHKSPSCGCCGLWVDHMRQTGFQVEVRDEDNVNPVKERVGVPSMCTVQEPHCATPQPYLVPVRPSCSRSTQSKGVSGSASCARDLPLTFSVAICVSSSREWRL